MNSCVLELQCCEFIVTKRVYFIFINVRWSKIPWVFSTVNQRQRWDAVLYFRFCVSAIYKICLKSYEMLFKVCTNRCLNICVSVSKFGLYKKIEFKLERCSLELWTWLAVAGLFILGKKKIQASEIWLTFINLWAQGSAVWAKDCTSMRTNRPRTSLDWK